MSEASSRQRRFERGSIGLSGATGWIAVLVAIQIVLVGAGLWFGVLSPAEASGPDGAPTPPDPARVRPATLESAWPMVDSRAREWDADARLFSASAQYDWPADPAADPTAPVGGWLIYVFVGGGGGEPESLSIMVERNRAAIVRETAARWGTDVPATARTDFRQALIGSSDALAAAETAAGRAFRSECRTARYVTRLTFQPGDEGTSPIWLLTYNDNRVRNGRALTITVAATTGQVTATPFTGANPSLNDLGSCPR